MLREILGDAIWASLTDEAKGLFGDTDNAVLAEMRGQGLNLSQDPLQLDEDQLARIRQQALIVSGEDSPEAYRLVNHRLPGALPRTRTVIVTGGHLINPARPAVLDYIERIVASPDSWTQGIDSAP